MKDSCSSSLLDACIDTNVIIMPTCSLSEFRTNNSLDSHMDLIGLQSDFVLGTWQSIVLSSPTTFAFSHPAPAGNVYMSAGLQR